MARNIGLERSQYVFFRQWLRSTQITWRDVTDSAIVPQWGEAICRKDCLDESNKTPGERAFSILKMVYPNVDLRWRKEEIALLDFRPPKLFQGEFWGELYALDIRAAYQQIYSRLFLHADFPRKRLKYPLVEVAERLAGDKEGRNAIAGIARSTRNKWVQGERVWYVKKQNRYLSPVLWAHLMLILNEIAQIAITNGAIYINTDGYAFRTAHERDSLASKLNYIGLDFTTCEGEGKIIGISALHIPGAKEPIELNVSQPTFHLESTDGTWLEWWKSLKP